MSLLGLKRLRWTIDYCSASLYIDLSFSPKFPNTFFVFILELFIWCIRLILQGTEGKEFRRHMSEPEIKKLRLSNTQLHLYRTYIVKEFGNQKAEHLFFVLSAFSFLDLYAV